MLWPAFSYLNIWSGYCLYLITSKLEKLSVWCKRLIQRLICNSCGYISVYMYVNTLSSSNANNLIPMSSFRILHAIKMLSNLLRLGYIMGFSVVTFSEPNMHLVRSNVLIKAWIQFSHGFFLHGGRMCVWRKGLKL